MGGAGADQDDLRPGLRVATSARRSRSASGHAILCARPLVGDEPFAVFLGDDIIVADPPCISQLLAVYEQFGNPVLAVERVPAASSRSTASSRDAVGENVTWSTIWSRSPRPRRRRPISPSSGATC